MLLRGGVDVVLLGAALEALFVGLREGLAPVLDATLLRSLRSLPCTVTRDFLEGLAGLEAWLVGCTVSASAGASGMMLEDEAGS